MTNENGTVVEKYAYDPWGTRRNPNNWTQADNRTGWITNRGYTGHEHIDMFKIINMNGRVYDPATAMFFSPDPFIQSPGDWSNYNRYSYVSNNPTRFTDPSGYIKGYFDTPKIDPYWSRIWNLYSEREPLNGSKIDKSGGGIGISPYEMFKGYSEALTNGYNKSFSSYFEGIENQTNQPNFNGKVTLSYYTWSSTTANNEFVRVSTKNTFTIDLYGRGMNGGNGTNFFKPIENSYVSGKNLPEYNTTLYEGKDFQTPYNIKFTFFMKNKIINKSTILKTITKDLNKNVLSTSYGPFSINTNGSYGLGPISFNFSTGDMSVSQEIHIPFTNTNYGGKITFNTNDLANSAYGFAFFIVENPELILLIP